MIVCHAIFRGSCHACVAKETRSETARFTWHLSFLRFEGIGNEQSGRLLDFRDSARARRCASNSRKKKIDYARVVRISAKNRGVFVPLDETTCLIELTGKILAGRITRGRNGLSVYAVALRFSHALPVPFFFFANRES